MFVEILVGSKVRSGPVLKTNTADSFLNMIFENHDGFLMDFFFHIRDSVPQVAETRFRVRTFGGWLRRFTVVWAGSLALLAFWDAWRMVATMICRLLTQSRPTLGP